MCGQPPNFRRLSLSLRIYSNVLTQNFWFNRSTKYICWLLHEHNQHLCLVASSLPGYILYDFTVSVHMVVSWNTSKSSIFIKKKSIINHPLWGIPVYGHPHMIICLFLFVCSCSHMHFALPFTIQKSPQISALLTRAFSNSCRSSSTSCGSVATGGCSQ